jgi:hypothetical protein
MKKKVVVPTLVLTLLLITAFGSAHGRFRAHHHVRVGVAHRHHGFGYHHHHAVFKVRAPNLGRIDFNVNPKNSKIFIDGAYLGVADDFDGGFFGSTANIRPGARKIRVVAPDGRTVERRVYVTAGREIDFDLVF